MWPLGGPEGAAQPDLGAAFEDRDDHDVRDADRADEEGDGTEAEEQAVEGALGVGSGDEGVGRLADVDLARGSPGWQSPRGVVDGVHRSVLARR